MQTVLQIRQGGKITAKRRVYETAGKFAVTEITSTSPDGAVTRVEIFHGYYENPLGVETIPSAQSDLAFEEEPAL